jgi:hypothetical protein
MCESVRYTAISESAYSCHTAKTQYRKFEIPRKGVAPPQSQFLHSCVCDRFISYSKAQDVNMLTCMNIYWSSFCIYNQA